MPPCPTDEVGHGGCWLYASRQYPACGVKRGGDAFAFGPDYTACGLTRQSVASVGRMVADVLLHGGTDRVLFDHHQEMAATLKAD